MVDEKKINSGGTAPEEKEPKLVRDLIPHEIETNGGECEWELIDGALYTLYALKKLREEAREVSGAKTLAELIAEIGDFEEIRDACYSRGIISPEEVKRKREEKAATRGRFEKGILLKKY